MASKSFVLPSQQQHSVKSNRSFLSYNLNDFLPPSVASISRTSSYAFKSKDKIYTQPNDRVVNGQVNQIKRKLDLNQQEKMNLKRELGIVSNALRSKEEVINQKDEIIKQLNSQIHRLQQEVKAMIKPKSNLSTSRNIIHFVYYPKFSQRYEVSVQTDAIQVTSTLTSSTFIKKPASKLADKDLHQIQQKLSKLNPIKKPKEKLTKQNDFLPKPKKLQKNETIFPKIDDKENMMRLSNTFQRVANIGQEKFREQTLQIIGIESDQIQRLIRLYME